MTQLTVEMLSHLKDSLDRRELELREDIQREMRQSNNYPEVSPDIPDPGDTSFANLAADLGNAAITRDLNELRAIQGARARIGQDTYGTCIACGYDIPYERLEVQPTAERCAPCQEVYEKTHADAMRGGTL
jgi:DnaK suppressor protein